MKYKIGDKVRVRKDLVPNSEYGGVCYVEFMDKFKDKECVITNMDDTSYRINNSEFWWTDEMLEPVNEGALLKYALEKLGMSKEELENEMNEDDEDIKKVKEFKHKYDKLGKMKCYGVFKYIKEKGEI